MNALRVRCVMRQPYVGEVHLTHGSRTPSPVDAHTLTSLSSLPLFS